MLGLHMPVFSPLKTLEWHRRASAFSELHSSHVLPFLLLRISLLLSVPLNFIHPIFLAFQAHPFKMHESLLQRESTPEKSELLRLIYFFSCFLVDFTSGTWYQVEANSPIREGVYRYSFRLEEYPAVLYQRHLSTTFFCCCWFAKWEMEVPNEANFSRSRSRP